MRRIRKTRKLSAREARAVCRVRHKRERYGFVCYTNDFCGLLKCAVYLQKEPKKEPKKEGKQ